MLARAGVIWGLAGLGGPSWPLPALAVGAGWGLGAQLGCQQDQLLQAGGRAPAGSKHPERSEQKLQVYFMTLPQKSHCRFRCFCWSRASDGQIQGEGAHTKHEPREVRLSVGGILREGLQ